MLLQPYLLFYKEIGAKNVLPYSFISIEHISMELRSTTNVTAEICNMYKYVTTFVLHVTSHCYRYYEVMVVCTSLLLQPYLLYGARNMALTSVLYHYSTFQGNIISTTNVTAEICNIRY